MKYKRKKNKGMTFPELVLAVLMLTAFTGVTVMVTQYTSKFLQPLNKVEESNEANKDMLNDHSQINYAFIRYEIISEPGIDKNFILNLKCTSYLL